MSETKKVEKLALQYLKAVQLEDFHAMRRLSQFSWRKRYPRIESQKMIYENLQDISDFKGVEVTAVTPVATEVIFKEISWITPVPFVCDLYMFWVKEDGYMSPSEEGKWGVNPFSFHLIKKNNHNERGNDEK